MGRDLGQGGNVGVLYGMPMLKEQRLDVMARVDRGELTAAAAATLLELSVRQVRRLVARYRDGGEMAVAHGNRGRRPAHTLGDDVRQRVIALARSGEHHVSTQQLSRLLAEREGVKVSRSSVRRILLEAGLPVTRSAR